MKTSRFSDSQILGTLEQEEADTPVLEVSREYGISSATFYKWRSNHNFIASVKPSATGNKLILTRLSAWILRLSSRMALVSSS